MNLSERWSANLEELRARSRFRQLGLPSGVDFASNDYLGYGNGRLGLRSPALPCSLSRSGMASRLLRGQHPIWDEVETGLARWHGAEASLVMTSGYTANLGLLSTVIEPQDWVASDELNHASLIDGLRLARANKFVYRHRDMDHLEGGLAAAAQVRAAQQQLFVITESLFGMDGDVAPLAELVELAQRYQAVVIVDEAHSTGCFASTGSGLVDAAGLRSRILATVHTGGKALAVPGAYVCGSALLRDLLINRCREFIFTTALPPQVGAWWLDALTRVQADHQGRKALHQAASLLHTELAMHGIHAPGQHYIVPVILGDDRRALQAAQQLQEAGWDIRAIRPPSVPPGSARLRISVHADHSPQNIVAVAKAIGQIVLSAEC